MIPKHSECPGCGGDMERREGGHWAECNDCGGRLVLNLEVDGATSRLVDAPEETREP